MNQTDSDPSARPTDAQANADYGAQFFNGGYADGGGHSYAERAHWLKHFETVAERLIADFQPSSVLEAGCAFGYLVEALRARGVAATGFDISDYAISQTAESVRSFCFVHSISQALPPERPQHYDLVVSIEVLEHIAPELALQAVANLCRYADTVIVSTTHSHVDGRTHYNVQQPEVWARYFALNGFRHNLDLTADYISPWTMVFERGIALPDCVQNAERHLRLREAEQQRWQNLATERDTLLHSQRNELAQAQQAVSGLTEQIAELETRLSTAQDEAAARCAQTADLAEQASQARHDLAETRRSTSWRITAPLRLISDILRFLFVGNRLARGLRRFLGSWRRDGLRRTLGKVRRRLRAGPALAATAAPHLDPASPVLAAPSGASSVRALEQERFRNLQAIPSVYVADGPLRLNLVTDSIEAHSLLGGVATALIIASGFARAYRLPLRIITRTTPVNPTNYYQILQLSEVEAPESVSFYSDHDRSPAGEKSFRLDISERDIFLATSWWSAEAILRTSLRPRFFYCLQEVETFFYPHGDEHLLCRNLFNRDTIDYLINSHYLYDYYQAHFAAVARQSRCFEPAFPAALYQMGSQAAKTRRTLFFYARPNNPRNLYYFGVRILARCVAAGLLEPGAWTICCVGGDVPALDFGHGVKSQSLGQLSWRDYARFLSTVDLALCLMYTPHPSYPPFDVASSGGVVVSNRCLNKTEITECANILLGDLDETAFLETMRAGIALACDLPRRQANYRAVQIQRSWADSLAPLIAGMGVSAGLTQPAQRRAEEQADV